MKTNWNNADTTLLCAFFIFLAAVGFQILNPGNVVADGILFVAEAALVGGVADWFAVTALFSKPLGFPYHTALLPNRRQEFIEASVKMVEQEFFSRRTIFKKVSNIHLLPWLIEYLEQEQTKKIVLTLVIEEIKKYFKTQNREITAKKISNELRRILKDVPAKILIHELGHWIKKSGKDKELFIKIIKNLREKAAELETRQQLEKILEKYAEEKTQSTGAFSLLMTGLAQMLDLVNFSEAAELMQMQVLKFLDELSQETELQEKILEECRKNISEQSETQEFKNLVEDLQIETVEALPIEVVIENALINITRQLESFDVEKAINSVCAEKLKTTKNSITKEKTLGKVLTEILSLEYENGINLLKNNKEVKTRIEKFIYELIARTMLYAQPLIGKIVKDALGNLTDEQLNSLVYEKAETDFVWIRMNGSIVGSIIGLALFLILQLV